jgi:hypothetical protein
MNYAKQTTIGKTVDESMYAIERENPSLKRVLNKQITENLLKLY